MCLEKGHRSNNKGHTQEKDPSKSWKVHKKNYVFFVCFLDIPNSSLWLWWIIHEKVFITLCLFYFLFFFSRVCFWCCLMQCSLKGLSFYLVERFRLGFRFRFSIVIAPWEDVANQTSSLKRGMTMNEKNGMRSHWPLTWIVNSNQKSNTPTQNKRQR